jgi:hypothetical protein
LVVIGARRPPPMLRPAGVLASALSTRQPLLRRPLWTSALAVLLLLLLLLLLPRARGVVRHVV